MKNVLKIAGMYLKQNIAFILTLLISFGIFPLVFSLYSLPFEAVAYAALLSGIFLFITAVLKFSAFYKKHLTLEKLKNSIAVPEPELPAPKGLIEKDYQELLELIDTYRVKVITEKDKALKDKLDYYTVWAHQIKTPIAAMRLLLQSEQSVKNNELLEQLFKVEQYIEMALQYLRMESMSSDLMFRRYSLDDMVKQAVRKYSASFIRKRITLDYRPLDRTVLTDEKWLVFVVEQLLSNALKYTTAGRISIYMDENLPDTLVIEDTGIGVEEEDLPRIFEKGFTGYNGRVDKKSTGLGLYLCRTILGKLSHTINIESAVGKGTKVKLGLYSKSSEDAELS